LFYKRLPNREVIKDLMKRTGTEDLFEKVEPFLPTQTLVTKNDLGFAFGEIDNLLSETPLVPFDYETVDELKHAAFTEAMSAQGRSKGGYVDVLSSTIVGASFTFGKNLQHTYYFPVQHKDTDNVLLESVGDVINECADQGKEFCVHNASFEEQITKQCLDIQLVDPWDTVIMSSYVDENADSSGLKALSETLFRYKMETYREVMEKSSAGDMTGVTGEQVLGYGCDDAFVSGHLAHLFHFIQRLEDTFAFYYQYDRATVHPLNRAFEAGVNIDFDQMKVLADNDQSTIAKGMKFIRAELSKHCSEESPKAALVLAKHEEEYLLAKFKDAGMPKDEARQKFETYKLGLIGASKYVPHETIRKAVDFKPTTTQIGDTLRKLGLLDDTYQFKSVAPNRITELLLTLGKPKEAANPLPAGYEGKPKEWLAEAVEVLESLAEAAGDPIKTREGKKYERLEEACRAVLERFSKVESVGDELNLSSPQQMQALLYCKLGLPVRKRSKVDRKSNRDKLGFQGSPGTDDKAIQMAVAEDCPEGDWRREVLKQLGEVKSAMTKFSLYYDKYPLWVHPRDGMIHPGIRNCGTVTRRPTGSNPNILQVAKGPTRTMFVPRYDGDVIIPMDFSGQELRITGSEAKDPILIEAYTGGRSWTDDDGMIHPIIKDVHTVTACSFAPTIIKRELGEDALQHFKIIDGIMDYDQFREIYNADSSQLDALGFKGKLAGAGKVMAQCRKMAKVVNFLIIYGGTAPTLAMGLGIPTEFAETIMKSVFSGYPRLAPWQEETIKYAYDNGFVKTAYGTWKHVHEDIRSKDGGLRSRAERQAVNQTVQGCAADILKIVLTEAYKKNIFTDCKATLIAPVYDEIVASVPIKNAFEYTQRMQEVMNVTPPGHPIPMVAEVSLGLNWGEVSELGDNPSEKAIVAAYDKLKEVA